MFVANFLDGPGTDHSAVNVQINFYEYLLAKINTRVFLEDISKKFGKDFMGSYYYSGVKYVCK